MPRTTWSYTWNPCNHLYLRRGREKLRSWGWRTKKSGRSNRKEPRPWEQHWEFMTPSLDPRSYRFYFSWDNRFSFNLSQGEVGFQLHITKDFLMDSDIHNLKLQSLNVAIILFFCMTLVKSYFWNTAGDVNYVNKHTKCII